MVEWDGAHWAEEILQEVQPSGNYEYDKNGYQLKRGRSANDPVDLSTNNRKKR